MSTKNPPFSGSVAAYPNVSVAPKSVLHQLLDDPLQGCHADLQPMKARRHVDAVRVNLNCQPVADGSLDVIADELTG
jgi:hypothetical protein